MNTIKQSPYTHIPQLFIFFPIFYAVTQQPHNSLITNIVLLQSLCSSHAVTPFFYAVTPFLAINIRKTRVFSKFTA